MADSVQRLLEEMVPELEELQNKKIFSAPEIKAIVTRRTAFEYRLKRKPPLKSDFLKYIDYENSLSKLRVLRKERLELTKNTSSDFAAARRIHFIYERGLRAFTNDLALWEQLIDHCINMKSTKRLSKIFPRALQHHPLKTRLWISAAKTEASLNNNIHAARVLMQRGLRLLPKDEDMWLCFIELELDYIRKIRKRREVLGLAGGGLTEHNGDSDDDDEEDEEDEDSENETETPVDTLDDDAKDEKFLSGALPAALFSHALTKPSIRTSLTFRLRCLDLLQGDGSEKEAVSCPVFNTTVRDDLEAQFQEDPEAWVIRAQWALTAAEKAAETEGMDMTFESTDHNSTKKKKKKRKRNSHQSEAKAPDDRPVEGSALDVLEAGIATITEAGSEMYTAAVEFLNTRLQTALVTRPDDADWLRSQILELSTRAQASAQCSEALAVLWVQTLLSAADYSAAEEACETVLRTYPSSVTLWQLRTKTHDHTRAQAVSQASGRPVRKKRGKNAKNEENHKELLLLPITDEKSATAVLYRRAFEALDKSSVQPLWLEFLLKHVADEAVSSTECEPVFLEGIKLFPGFKETYLDWKLSLVKKGGEIDEVQTALDVVLVSPPISLSLILKCIRIGKALLSSTESDYTIMNLEQLFEKALAQFGTSSVELWLLYGKHILQLSTSEARATSSLPASLPSISKVYKRALRILSPSLHSEFNASYQELCS